MPKDGDKVEENEKSRSKRIINENLKKQETKPKIPIEFRDLFPEFGGGSMGKLGIWIEIIPAALAKIKQPWPIAPIPQYEFEVRTIVNI